MSFTYSLAQEAGSLPENCSDIAALERSSANPVLKTCSLHDSETEACRPSRSSATSGLSTVGPTEGELMSWLEAFHAKHSAEHLEDDLWRKTSGRKCSGSWQMSLPGTSLPRTLQRKPSTMPQTTWRRWLIPSDAWRFPRQTWVLTTFGSATGFLHTPTHTANYACRSMQKWPNCREFVRVFGKPNPTNHEWLMGWPLGWSDASRPLGTDRFRLWLQQHFES